MQHPRTVSQEFFQPFLDEVEKRSGKPYFSDFDAVDVEQVSHDDRPGCYCITCCLALLLTITPVFVVMLQVERDFPGLLAHVAKTRGVRW